MCIFSRHGNSAYSSLRPGSNIAYNSHRKVCHLILEEQSMFEEKDDLHPLRRPRDAKPYTYINPYIPRTVAYDPVATMPTTVTAQSVTLKSTLKPGAPVYTPKSAGDKGARVNPLYWSPSIIPDLPGVFVPMGIFHERLRICALTQH